MGQQWAVVAVITIVTAFGAAGCAEFIVHENHQDRIKQDCQDSGRVWIDPKDLPDYNHNYTAHCVPADQLVPN